MSRPRRQAVPPTEAEPMGCLPALVRLTWIMFGNVALLVCASFVAKGTAPVAADAAFFSVALGLIVLRYVDITRFKGRTSEGQPATLAHWRRYSVVVALLSVGLWTIARVAASRGWL